VESTDGLRGTFEYATDLFEPGRIELLADHLRVLFESLVSAPDQRIGCAPLLTADEHQRIVFDWNATRRDYPRDRCAHHLVQQQARQRPNAVAVRLGDREVTYRELDERANALARHLTALGVGPDVPVAVCAHRTPEMVVGVLAALKAGSAYLPLDPTYPAERLRFILEDVGAPVLLTERELLADLPPTAAHIVLLDDEYGCAVDAPIVDVQPDHLSYLIYTSGSTGRPKGIGLPHKGLVNLVTWYHRAYDLRPEDRMAHLAGASFDVGVGDIWTPLTCGASLDLPPDEESRVLPRRILAWLAERRITVAFLATPLAELVLHEPLPKDLRLRHLLVAGDKLNRPPRAGLPFSVADNYGPAENTIFSTWTHLTPTTTHIGRPLDNVRAYVLDRYGQPVPVGVPGEIYLGGDNLARGYVGRPDLTADRFMPDHLSGDIGGRLYRTGDLARFRPDGTIVFLGRIDHQVKIRGFRIELGEVQSALAQHPDVRDCAVILRSSTTVGDKQLVGYVVSRNGHTPNTSEVRAFLRRSLPEYMLPSFVMPLDALPLTHNGKLDRRALPQPDDGTQPADEVPPDGFVEERLAAIWCDVLHVPSVGCTANFFELGGHSLLVTQVLFRVYETFGIDLPLRAVFEAPTIQQLGRVIETALAAELETLSAVEA
jgi:amino acid adenylation domain-containing protein